MEETLIKWVGSLGFPIVVSLFLLWEGRREIRNLTRAIHRLTEKVERLSCLERREETKEL